MLATTTRTRRAAVAAAATVAVVAAASMRMRWAVRAMSSGMTTASASVSASGGAIAAAPVRTRFAPSPTGFLHLGGLRTALYNYLLAEQAKRTHAHAHAHTTATPPPSAFLVRIEDTDQKRKVEGAVEHLLQILAWANVRHDEGPRLVHSSHACIHDRHGHDHHHLESVGDYGPYVQSERLPIYRRHAIELVERGHAYPCFCSSERLDELREQQLKRGLPTVYDRLCANHTPEQAMEKIAQADRAGQPYVIRMKIPTGTTVVQDVIRGPVVFPNKTVEDQVLLKSDGYPTYHLAVVVDDHNMRISHVIRGEEWMASAPKHVILYKMFGWELPVFTHLPLLLKPDGSKLSKRHDDASAEYYMKQGFLPSAVINFVALLGWNPGTTQEVFSLDELIAAFSLPRIQKAGAVVNLQKMHWFNAQHLRLMAEQQMPALIAQLKPQLVAANPHARFVRASGEGGENDANDGLVVVDDAYVGRVLHSLREHVTLLPHFVEYSRHFFARDLDFSTDAAKAFRAKAWPADAEVAERLLRATLEALEALSPESFAVSSTVAATLKPVHERLQMRQRALFLLLRYALTASEIGPSLSVIVSMLGKLRVVRRLRRALSDGCA